MQGTVSKKFTDSGSTIETVAKREGFLNRGFSAGNFDDFFGFLEREFVKVDLPLGFPDHLPFGVVWPWKKPPIDAT